MVPYYTIADKTLLAAWYEWLTCLTGNHMDRQPHGFKPNQGQAVVFLGSLLSIDLFQEWICFYKLKPFYTIKLTITMTNFLNGIIHLPFSEHSIIIFRDVKMYKAWSDCTDVQTGLVFILVAKAVHIQCWQDKC